MGAQPGTSASTKPAGYTAVVHYPAPAGDSTERDAAAERVVDTVMQHDGHRGSVVLRGGSDADPELYLVVTFDDHASWSDWNSSEPAQRALRRLEEVTGAPAEGHFLDSMAGWFNLPGVSGLRTPPRWKSCIVIFVTITPISIILMYVLAPFTEGLHPILNAILSSVILVPLLTYVATPAVTRLVRGWLYPQASVGLVESFPSSR